MTYYPCRLISYPQHSTIYTLHRRRRRLCRLESIYDSSLLRNHTIPYIHICVSNSRSGARTHDLLGFTQKVNRPGLIAVPRRPSALPASVQWFATHCRSIHLVTLRCRYHTLPRRGTTGLIFMCESSLRAEGSVMRNSRHYEVNMHI